MLGYQIKCLQTPLSFATGNNRVEAVKLLLEAEANVAICNKVGRLVPRVIE
jgi:ankyrin repeat protein